MFVAYGGEGCTLNQFHPYVAMTNSRTGEDGGLEDCLDISIHTSNRVLYGVVYKSAHTCDRYRDVLFDQLCSGDPGEPMSSTVYVSEVRNVSGD